MDPDDFDFDVPLIVNGVFMDPTLWDSIQPPF